MAFDFERVKREALAATKTAGDKVNEVSALAKLRLAIRTKEDFINQQYMTLGKAYYEAHKDDLEPAEGTIAEIKAAQLEIDELNDQLLNLQGAVQCPVCGMKQKKDHAFCSSCGAALQ